MRSRALLLTLLACASAVVSPALHAQASVTLAPDDPVYLDVDRLINSGLVDSAIVGQRPYSLRMLARIAGEARRHLEVSRFANGLHALDRQSLSRLLQVLDGGVAGVVSDPPVHARTALLRSFRGELLATDASRRAISDNGVGTVEATIAPLTSFRLGRQYLSGATIGLESEHWLQVGSALSLQARPRLSELAPRGGRDGDVSLDLLAGSARLVVANVALSAGREYTLWSQAPEAGLFFSEHGPALDMIRVSSDVPFLLPSLLRRLGPVAATLQIADLGPSLANSHSRLVSYKVSIRPAPTAELGATFANHFGGRGARNPSAFNRFVDNVPFLDIFRRHADSTDFDSDKLLGLDGRVRLRRAGNVTLFGEMALEDFDVHRLGSIFTEDAAYSVGLSVPQLGSPSLSGRVLYHTLGIRFYEHHLVRNGIASRGFLLGDPLGRDANGVSAMLRWENLRGVAVTGDAALEEYRNDRYEGSYTNADQTGLVFRRLSTGPRERRVRGILGVRWRPGAAGVMVELRGGAERTSNDGGMVSPGQTHAVAAIAVTTYR